MALTTLSQIKDFLGIAQSNTAKDVQLNALRAAAESAVIQYCYRDFTQNTYTEYYSGNNTQKFTLRQRPVTNVASLYLANAGYFGTGSDTFDSTTQLLEGTDWVLDRPTASATESRSGVVYRIGTVWPILNQISILGRLAPFQGPSWGNIKVTYTAGYATIPMDIQYAVCLFVSYMQRTVQFGGMMLQSEKLGDYAYTLLLNPKHELVLGSLEQILGAYREIPW